MILTYVEYEWRIKQCQIMTERDPARAAATKKRNKRVAAAAKNSSITAKTAPAATTANSTDTTANTAKAKAAVANKKRNSPAFALAPCIRLCFFWLGQNDLG